MATAKKCAFDVFDKLIETIDVVSRLAKSARQAIAR